MKQSIKTATGTFTLRPYADADEGDVLSLWREVFGKELPVSLWRWKYIRNPFGHQILLCLDMDGEIVALYGGIPYTARLRLGTVRLTQLMDIMTHSRVRKSGLFIQVAHEFFDFVERDAAAPIFLYGFPGQYHLSIGLKYLRYEKCVDQVAFFRTNLQTLLSGSLYEGEHVRRMTREDMPAVDRLWAIVEKEYPLSVIRDSSFLRWRFVDHPIIRYDIFGLWNAVGNLVGYVVLGYGEERARILDILVPNSPETLHRLLNGVCKYLVEYRVEAIETWLPSLHFTAGFLRKFGFEELLEPLGITTTVRRLTWNPCLTWISGNLYYTMADADLF